jgi:hypothetical protein
MRSKPAATDYTVCHTYGSEFVVKCDGRIIATFDSFEYAENRAYQLNRARLLN